MIQAKKNPSPEDLGRALQGMLIRMWNNVMLQFNHVGPRILIDLLDLDLVDTPATPIDWDINLEVLHNPNHPLRLKLPPGPLFLFLRNDEKSERIVINVPILLCSELPKVREEAFFYLENQIVDKTFAVTPKTLGILKSSRTGLLSDTPHEWRSAAIALNDAFNNDALVALQGVKQCLESETILQDSLNSFVPRMMRPTVSSLDSIIFKVRNPEREHSKMMEIISSITESAASLHDACEIYYLHLGHIPLASPYSMGEIVDHWKTAHPDDNTWEEVWNWANSSFGPVPRFHACSVFVQHPELVPKEKLPDLWREILDVVNVLESNDSQNTKGELWRLRYDLIRHFTCHLEAHLPENDGDIIACFAWWLAEQVAKVFPDKTESVQFYHKTWVDPAVTKSTFIWLAASSRIGSSHLRYATATMPFPWVIALLGLMGRKLEEISPEKQDAKLQLSFNEILVSCLISSLPITKELPADPTYAMEYPLGETVLKWATHQPEEQRKILEQLESTSRTLGTADGLIAAFRKLTEYSVADQEVVACIFRSLVYRNISIATCVWDLIADKEWQQRVLGSIEDQVLEILIEALSLLQVQDKENRFFLLPHYLADVCEKTESAERKRQLFMHVLQTSLNTDTVSAIQRLLRGNQKVTFAQYTKEYCTFVENMWPYYPAWVQGRLRGLLASLHTV